MHSVAAKYNFVFEPIMGFQLKAKIINKTKAGGRREHKLCSHVEHSVCDW